MLRKRCMVFDMDGTVYLGPVPIEGTVNFIKKNWGRIDFQFLSNNTSKSPVTYVKRLNSMGIPATLNQILTPITPLIHYLKRIGIKRAYLVGNTDFVTCMKERMPELTNTAEGAEAVILAYDTELTYEKIKTSALLLLDKKVEFLATHPDFVCPTDAGPLPDIGSFIRMYEAATGRSPQRIFGKPCTEVLEPVLSKYERKDVCMVGDRLMTDKVLGENAGIDFILVLSGETTEADLPKVHKQERIKALKRLFHIGPADKRLPQKTYILPDLGSLVFEDDK